MKIKITQYDREMASKVLKEGIDSAMNVIHTRLMEDEEFAQEIVDLIGNRIKPNFGDVMNKCALAALDAGIYWAITHNEECKG